MRTEMKRPGAWRAGAAAAAVVLGLVAGSASAFADSPNQNDHTSTTPVIVSVSPDPANAGQVLTITISDPSGTYTGASFQWRPNSGQTVNFDASSLVQGTGTTWIATATAPDATSNESGDLRVWLDKSTSSGTTDPSSPFAFGLNGQPQNELPEAPYAAIFPAALLLAFGAVTLRRRRRHQRPAA